MEPGDIDAVYRWENDPAVWTYSAAHQPFSRHALQQFIDESSGSDIYTARQLRLMADTVVTDSKPATTIGCIDLYDFDPYHRRAAIGLLVDSAQRGKGYGTAMLAELEVFAAEHLNLHQLHSIVAADNTQSIKLFTQAGYTKCGTLRDWMASAQGWTDAFVFQKII